jgi:hypothetical protein
MPRNYPPIDPEKIVKIECFDLPQHYEAGEGEYELRWGHKPDEYELHDLLSLERALKKLMPTRVDDILCRLQNFRKAFLNLATGEITS